jgi:hypothetical protein
VINTVTCRIPPDWLINPSQCWYEWQGLVSGLLAIAAASYGALLLNKQIAQAEVERRTRRFNAVRATLPLTLSGICTFSKDMLSELSPVRSAMAHLGSGPLPNGFSAPSPPSDLVNALQDMIEATSQHNVVGAISEMISEIQTLSSRVAGLSDQAQMARAIGMDRNIDEYIIQAARIYAISESLFDFARRKDETGPRNVPWDRVYSALHFANIEDHQFPDLYADLAKRSQRLEFAWLGKS